MKIVVLELGFEDDDDAETFADAVSKQELDEIQKYASYDVIECKVENP